MIDAVPAGGGEAPGRRAWLWGAASLLPMLLWCVMALPVVFGGLREAAAPDGRAFGSDEGLHAMYSMAIRQDILRCDWRSLLDDTWVQGQWPPGLSWVDAVLTLGLPPTPASQRGVMVLLIPLLGLIAWWAARETLSGLRWAWVGAAYAGLMAVSAPATMTFGSMVMMEIPGMVLVLACLAAYLRARRAGTGWLWWLAGALLAAAWLMKFQHGAGLSVALALDLWLRKEPAEGDGRKGAWVLFGVPALLLAAWFVDLRHVRDALIYLTRTAKQTGVFPLASYPWWVGEVLSDFHVHAVAGAVGVAGLLAGAIALRRWRLFPAFLYSLVCLFVIARLPIRYPHYGYWLAPGLWLLGAGALCVGLGRLSGRGSQTAAAAVLAVLVATGGLLAHGTAQRAMVARQIWCPPAERWAIYEAIGSAVPASERLVTFGGWTAEVNPFSMKWWYLSRGGVRLGDLYVEDWRPKQPGYKAVKLRWPPSLRDPSRDPLEGLSPTEVLDALGVRRLALIELPGEALGEEDGAALPQIARDPGWSMSRAQPADLPGGGRVVLLERK